jgi:hypothetical protein
MKKAYPLLTLNGLTRVSTEHQVSKEEFAKLTDEIVELKARLVQIEEDRDRLYMFPAIWENMTPKQKRHWLEFLKVARAKQEKGGGNQNDKD